MQLLLDGHGLYVPVSGDFDVPTVAAVRAFQTEAGLTVDGKAGAQTKKPLYALPRGTVQAGSVTVTESVNAASVARCLDNRGSDVQVWGCNGTDAQNWALYRVAGQGTRYRAVNRGSHLYLDAGTGTTGQNGQEIQATSCDGLSARTWQLGGGGTLVSVPDGFCLDAEASTSGPDGQRVQGWGCAGSVTRCGTGPDGPAEGWTRRRPSPHSRVMAGAGPPVWIVMGGFLSSAADTGAQLLVRLGPGRRPAVPAPLPTDLCSVRPVCRYSSTEVRWLAPLRPPAGRKNRRERPGGYAVDFTACAFRAQQPLRWARSVRVSPLSRNGVSTRLSQRCLGATLTATHGPAPASYETTEAAKP
ncbi:RICIN domain-containing protein [Streptomyces broussonetiae]|uniref:RICIN domain-containing protein n=1 Tax=Streptomyces broussonetiae TaxID=2686304 RepID=UPI001E4703B0|nr:RICIN domain-containing protein [Streptomyces broussonetiae]